MWLAWLPLFPACWKPSHSSPSAGSGPRGWGLTRMGKKSFFFFFFSLSPRTSGSRQEATLMSKMSEMLPTKQNGYLLQAPWHRPSGESFIPLLLPVRANKHMLPDANGAAHCPPGSQATDMLTSRILVQTSPSSCGRGEKFFKRAANPCSKTSP